jgi:type II secretory ATPase GspE/PulE/Tfp pilus assembly ATPase PilB-like protein
MRAETTNILTIEDPIEYQIAGVNQTQVDEAISLTFAGAMRSALRQDPDVILLGELRDGETAALAAEAGRTGALVCSSLHADAAAPAAVRLGELGVEPHAIASALLGVIAQRLVRRLCASCRQPGTPSRATLTALNIADPEDAPFVFYKAVGCDQCNYTGFRGRTGIFEVMRVDDAIRRLILARAPSDQIREAAMLGGMISLAEDGLSKVSSGVTTAEELLRVVADIRDMRPLCPACGAAVAGDFLACPRCGERLGATCPHCQRALQPEWTFCPYCAHGATESRRSSPRPVAEGPRLFPGDNVTEFKK